MRRREFLGGLGTATGAGIAGCLGFELQEASSNLEPPVVEDRPDAVYYPTHVEGMQMAGMAKSGPYACALTYTYPHRFWLVTGSRREAVEVASDDSLHLMPVVWHQETGIVPPDVNPQLRLRRDGETVSSLSPWPMLSQPMGFHFGDNVKLPSEGTYEVEVAIGEGSARRTGSLASAGRASFEFTLDYAASTLEEIQVTDIPDEREGSPGAVSPTSMEMMPATTVPGPDTLPGDVSDSATSGDASFVVTTIDDASRFGGGDEETYLAVSPRTPYNRYVLPLMSLSATVTRGGEPVADTILTPAIDPDVHYHYGAAISGVESGDELSITVDAPPQIARHEGYEMAFFEMPAMTLTL